MPKRWRVPSDDSGQVEENGNESGHEVWERLVKRSPLSFYSQLVFGRLPELAPSKRLAWRSYLPEQKTAVSFCAGSLAQRKALELDTSVD